MDTIPTLIPLAYRASESMSNQLVRARELAIIAANGTMTATDRQNISTELAQIIEQVLALANTRDSSGNYIFPGAHVGALAFARDASGAILWRGSGEPPRVPVNADVTVSMGVSRPDWHTFALQSLMTTSHAELYLLK